MTEQTGPTRGGTLVIQTDGDRSHVEISGTREHVMRDWVALSNEACKALGISPSSLAYALLGGFE